MLKLFAGSLLYAGAAIGTVLLDASGAGLISSEWIIGILVTVLIAVLTAMGAIIKIAYDTARKWEVILGGVDSNEEKTGFIEQTAENHEELTNHQEELYEQLLIQGRLLSELSYSFADIAKELEEADDVDIKVNLDRIERLREEKDDRDL